jgi:hypothetical protein
VALLESTDCKVQRAAAGALRTLAFKNEANKNQVWSQAGCFGGVVWLAGYVARGEILQWKEFEGLVLICIAMGAVVA